MQARRNITDRAQRYRAQKNVTGPKRCVLCGSRADIQVMHLTGNESHGEAANLAYGCRSCNGKLSAAFKAVGAGRPTNQYNPSQGVPSFEQYMWAVSNHTRGAHDAGGSIIHATPKHKRIEYARRIVTKAQRTKRERFEDRWNPAPNATTAKHERDIRAYITTKAAAGWTAEQIYRAVWRRWGYVGQAKDGAVHLKMHGGPEVFRVNPWPFSKSAPAKRRAGMTLAEATAAATKAGAKSRDIAEFDAWLEAKHLTDRSDAVVSRIRDAYKRGVDSATAGKTAAVLSIPDERIIRAGFQRGLTLREILGNPADESVSDKSWREWAENFERVQRDPLAASAKDLRRAIGYLDKARRSLIRRAQDKGSAVNANVLAVYDNEYEYLKSLMLKRERGNPSKFPRIFYKDVDAKGRERFYHDSNVGRRLTLYPVEEAKLLISTGQARVIPKKRRGNPAAGSAEVFEEFHGFEPSEVVTVTKHVHHHEHLAAAGKLTHLDVWGIDGQGHKLTGFEGAFLAFNESKNQLFVEGGDQSINLDDFGIRKPHEVETLGKVTDIGYQTNKTHLGAEGGEAVYVHKFRSTNQAGRHVIVKIAREPDLIYDVRNEQLLFSGGSYEILREGINK